MASAMIKCIAKRGRAYECVTCQKRDEKARLELHFYKAHVLDVDVPFRCILCDFRCGDIGKRDKHLTSFGHLERVGNNMISSELSLIISNTPRVIDWEKDVNKLSRSDSAEHWLSIGIAASSPRNKSDGVVPSEEEYQYYSALNADVMVRKADGSVQVEKPCNCREQEAAEVAALKSEVISLKALVATQGQMLKKILDKTTKAYELVGSVRREQDRSRRERQPAADGDRRVHRSRSRH